MPIWNPHDCPTIRCLDTRLKTPLVGYMHQAATKGYTVDACTAFVVQALNERDPVFQYFCLRPSRNDSRTAMSTLQALLGHRSLVHSFQEDSTHCPRLGIDHERNSRRQTDLIIEYLDDRQLNKKINSFTLLLLILVKLLQKEIAPLSH